MQKLHAPPQGYRPLKARLAAAYANVALELTPDFKMGVDNKSPSFLKLNPLGKVPVLETPEGPIFESQAIATYVAKKGDASAQAQLLGSDPYSSALIHQWVDFTVNEVEPPRSIWYYTIKGFLPPNPKNIAEAKKDLESAFKLLDTHFLKNTYLVGHLVSLADITLFVASIGVFDTLFSPAFVKTIPNVRRWFLTIANQPQVLKIIPSVTFATVEGAPAKPVKAEKPAAPAKKEEKKAEPKPKDDEGDDDEKPAPKKKNVLDDLG